jgi:8-oxo-dGTP diphosphatase
MGQDTSKHWDVGVTGAVVQDSKVLFVRRNYEPNKGTWTLPGGYANHDETLDEAVRRELREETGIEILVQDIIGVRTRYSDDSGAVLVIFRASVERGVLKADNYEISAAEFFDAAEITALTPVFPLSRALGLEALRAETGGLVETPIEPTTGPRWKAFTLPPD